MVVTGGLGSGGRDSDGVCRRVSALSNGDSLGDQVIARRRGVRTNVDSHGLSDWSRAVVGDGRSGRWRRHGGAGGLG